MLHRGQGKYWIFVSHCAPQSYTWFLGIDTCESPPPSKRHLDQFSPCCGAHSRDQQTHTDNAMSSVLCRRCGLTTVDSIKEQHVENNEMYQVAAVLVARGRIAAASGD